MACVGKATSDELRSCGHRAEFIGQSTDTKLIGKQFAAKVGNAKVLFPVARESMQSIQNQFPKRENAINLVVYATLKHSFEIPDDTDIVIFTSPSNVEAFFEKNKLKENQKAVAMGDATKSALMRKKIKENVISTPITFDDLGLFQSVLHF